MTIFAKIVTVEKGKEVLLANLNLEGGYPPIGYMIDIGDETYIIEDGKLSKPGEGSHVCDHIVLVVGKLANIDDEHDP